MKTLTLILAIMLLIPAFCSAQSKWDAKITIHAQGNTLSELAKLEKLVRADYDSISVEIVKYAEPKKHEGYGWIGVDSIMPYRNMDTVWTFPRQYRVW